MRRLARAKTTAIAVPVVTTPQFPDFVRPVVPADLATLPAASNQERAWQFLQAGDLHDAEREVAAALKAVAGFYPAETTGGYVAAGAKGREERRWRDFDRALERRSDYAPALAGKGEALVALNRDGEAIDAFQAALTADPSLTDLTRRVEVLRFRGVERDVTAARQAAQSGKTDDALRAYRVAIDHSPDTAFLYRERGVIEREHGDADAALADFRKAVALDASDAASLVEIARAARRAQRLRRGAEGVQRRARARAERAGRGEAQRDASRGLKRRACRLSTAPSRRRRRSPAAIWRRSSASAWRRCCRRRARGTSA